MSGTIDLALDDCRRAGCRAFRDHGVTWLARHSFPHAGPPARSVLRGHTEERHHAHDRALYETLSFHRLCVRDNAKDRAWAERLSIGDTGRHERPKGLLAARFRAPWGKSLQPELHVCSLVCSADNLDRQSHASVEHFVWQTR